MWGCLFKWGALPLCSNKGISSLPEGIWSFHASNLVERAWRWTLLSATWLSSSAQCKIQKSMDEKIISIILFIDLYILKSQRTHSHVDKKLQDCSHSCHRAFASRQRGWKVLPIDPPIARPPPTQLLLQIKTTDWNQIWKKTTGLRSHVLESQPNKTPLGEATTARSFQ